MSPNSASSLVFDASVTINFLGTGMAGRLLGLLGCPVLMADRTFAEIRRHPLGDGDHVQELDGLRRSKVLEVRELPSPAKELFFELTSADLSGGLDDGEAAAIALAVTLGTSAVTVVDDRKARALLAQRWPQYGMQYTADLFTYDRIGQSLSRAELADAVYSALLHARMRVPRPNRVWIESLIGVDRAKNCPSLGSRGG